MVPPKSLFKWEDQTIHSQASSRDQCSGEFLTSKPEFLIGQETILGGCNEESPFLLCSQMFVNMCSPNTGIMTVDDAHIETHLPLERLFGQIKL